MEEDERDSHSLSSRKKRLRKSNRLSIIQVSLPKNGTKNVKKRKSNCDENLNNLNKGHGQLLEEGTEKVDEDNDEDKKPPIDTFCEDGIMDNPSEDSSPPFQESEMDVEPNENGGHQKNWTDVYRKLRDTISQIYNEVTNLSGSEVAEQDVKFESEEETEISRTNNDSEGEEKNLICDVDVVDSFALEPESDRDDSGDEKMLDVLQTDNSIRKNVLERPKKFQCIYPNCMYSSDLKANVIKHGKIHYKNKCKSSKNSYDNSKKCKPTEKKLTGRRVNGRKNKNKFDSFSPSKKQKKSGTEILNVDNNNVDYLINVASNNIDDLNITNNNVHNLNNDASSNMENLNNINNYDIENSSDENNSFFLRDINSPNSETKPKINSSLSDDHYTCSICGFATIYKSSLTRHMILKHSNEQTRSIDGKLVHKEEKYTCSKCSYESNYLKRVKIHETEHHASSSNNISWLNNKITSSKMYSCFECDYTTEYVSNLERHEKNHKNYEKKLPLINKKMRNKGLKNLRASPRDPKNVLSDEEENRIKNKMRKDDDDDVNRIKNKVRKEDSNRIKNKVKNVSENEIIDDEVVTIDENETNSKNESENNEIENVQKSSIEDEESESNSQKMILDVIDLKLFKCSECSFVAKNKGLVSKHLRKHPKSKNSTVVDAMLYKCSVCKFTSSNFFVKKHLPNHLGLLGKVYKCAICDYISPLQHNVWRHEDKKHPGESIIRTKPNIIESIKGASKTLLEILQDQAGTLQEFTDESPTKIMQKYAECLLSKKRVKRLTYLHICKICPYKTNVSSNFANHKLTHLKKNKYFKCSTCNFKTIWKNNLKIHEYQHLASKIHKCERCDFSTNFKKSLRTHYKNKH